MDNITCTISNIENISTNFTNDIQNAKILIAQED